MLVIPLRDSINNKISAATIVSPIGSKVSALKSLKSSTSSGTASVLSRMKSGLIWFKASAVSKACSFGPRSDGRVDRADFANPTAMAREGFLNAFNRGEIRTKKKPHQRLFSRLL